MERKRGLFTALLDRLVARQLGLPPETCSWTVSDIRIPVQHDTDRFELVADLYQPLFTNDTKPKGTILVRCPYGHGLAYALTNAHFYAARGYNCLYVSCRGTFGSGGIFEPWRNEEEDGHAVVEWMREQEWYTGTFATLGSSYLGFVQWALLKNPPPDMIAAVIQCAPHDFGQQLWGTGALAMEWFTWGERLLHQEEEGFVKTMQALNTPRRMRSVLDKPPMVYSVKAHLNGRAPWLDFVADHPDTSDPFYKSMNCSDALRRAEIPVFLVTGWQDVFVRQTIEQYTRLHSRGTTVSLLIGPWTHMQLGMATQPHQQSYAWLESQLSKQTGSALNPGVQYFVTGAKAWRHTPTWPPPTTPQTLYLAPNKALSHEAPSTETTSSSSFTTDPNHPTPTIGGSLLLGGGALPDTPLSSRPDVLHFTSPPLSADLEVCGPIVVELAHASDVQRVDLAVRVSEVDAGNRSRLVTETYRRFEAREESQTVVFRLDDCAHRFVKGSRVRVYVAGASHPRFAGVEGGVVHWIFHGKGRMSRVVLPVAVVE